ncbi:MAG TPA: hypothetical protein VH008_22120, partial [Pseudonocardia sp.]|nr:hypothetical protein [Pseudonocardia sp.]
RVVGAVLLHLDYRAPVLELRARARRIVEESALWDRREWTFQVVDSTPWSMVVRVLASAADGPSSWDLRCEIREALIAYLAAEHPEAFPGQDLDRRVSGDTLGGSGHLSGHPTGQPFGQPTGGAELGLARSDGARPGLPTGPP